MNCYRVLLIYFIIIFLSIVDVLRLVVLLGAENNSTATPTVHDVTGGSASAASTHAASQVIAVALSAAAVLMRHLYVAARR